MGNQPAEILNYGDALNSTQLPDKAEIEYAID
jgi:hypothetical protein